MYNRCLAIIILYNAKSMHQTFVSTTSFDTYQFTNAVRREISCPIIEISRKTLRQKLPGLHVLEFLSQCSPQKISV